MNLNLLKTFIKVAEFGSYTKAAHHLKQPKSRVSRSIVSLEAFLNAELIKRTTRSISLTEAGKNLFQDTQGLIYQIERKVESLADESGAISGTLSISAPIDFGEYIMPTLVCEFSKIHPQIDFRILLSDSYVDLAAQDIDLALRVGKLKDSSLKQKKLADTQLILVASDEYLSLKGKPKKWKDFVGHTILSFYNDNKQDPLSDIYLKYEISPSMRVNSFPMLKQLALESKGVALLSSTVCKRELDNGSLVRVLTGWNTQKSPLHMVFSATKNLPPKTRAFLDFLSEAEGLFC